MKWITRHHVKVDRVACPWLIRRFIDPVAEFLFVAEDELLVTAIKENAIPFDAPRLREIKLNHRGDRCTFEAIIEDYHLSEPGLSRLALIVRAADIKVQELVAPEGLGLRAIAEGFGRLGFKDDHEINSAEWIVYDALYAYCQEQVGHGKPDTQRRVGGE
jgi:hypothetical protein